MELYKLFCFYREENIVGKKKNGCHNYILFPQCFRQLSNSGLSKVGIVWYRANSLSNKKILDFKAFAVNK